MVRKIDINSLSSLDKIKEIISNLQNESDQYIFTDDNKMIAVLASPIYFDKFIEKDVVDTVDGLRRQNEAKRDVIKFLRDIQEFNKNDDPEEIQADIDEAIREVKKAELKKLQIVSD